MKNRTAICTWSLKNDLDRVSAVLQNSGLNSLHLDASALETFKDTIRENGWTVTCTMVSFPQEDYSTLETIRETGGILPDDDWPQNRKLTLNAIQATAQMQVPFLSTHAGFIDHTNADAYTVFCDRMRELADAAKAQGVMLLMETGQESAEELRDFLEHLNHPSVGVNFDPANMILYAKGDPIEAVRILAPWIKHVHFKDALATKVPGEWGQEVPWGDGEVGVAAFLNALEEIGYTGYCAIEREAGDQREEDILNAVKQLN